MNYVKCPKNGSKVPGKCRDGREWLGSRKSSEEEEKKVIIYSDRYMVNIQWIWLYYYYFCNYDIVDRKRIINKEGKIGVLQRTVQCDSSKGRKEDIWRGVLGNTLKVIENKLSKLRKFRFYSLESTV